MRQRCCVPCSMHLNRTRLASRNGCTTLPTGGHDRFFMVFVMDKGATVDPLASFVSVPRAIKRRANDRRFEQKRALQRPAGRSPLAKSLGQARHLRHEERRPQAEILRAGDVPLPLGAHPYGACPQLHDGRRRRALQARHGQRGPASDGLGCLRYARRERRHRP